MALAILFGLLAAACYGAANLVGRFSGKALGVVATLVWSQAFLLACASIALAIYGPLPSVPVGAWGRLALSNLMIVAATACLYGGLAKGRLSMVAPVMASYAALTALLSILTGERATLITATGLTLTIVGAVLCALPSKSEKNSGPSGLWFGLGAALFYGVGYWLQGTFVLPTFGPVPTIWLYYATSTSLFAFTAFVLRSPLFTFEGPKDVGLLVATAALSGGGFAAMMIAQTGGEVAIATALSSTATAITVLLALAVLKEKPGWSGWAGVAAVVGGIVTLQFTG